MVLGNVNYQVNGEPFFISGLNSASSELTLSLCSNFLFYCCDQIMELFCYSSCVEPLELQKIELGGNAFVLGVVRQ